MAKRNRQVYHKVYRKDMHACYKWCLDNNIKIYPIASNSSEQFIEVNNNGHITKSKEAYKIKELHLKIWELYCHFYDTNTKK